MARLARFIDYPGSPDVGLPLARVFKQLNRGEIADCKLRLHTYDMGARVIVEVSAQDMSAGEFDWPVDTDGDVSGPYAYDAGDIKRTAQ